MSEAEVIEKLKGKGRWREGMELEPLEWFTEKAPPGAFDSLEGYRLIDREYTPARDAPGRNWTPVVVAGNDVLVDPSPAMFDALLRGARYFEQPEAFGDGALLHFHRLAFDFYDGYHVREESFEFKDGSLRVRGEASRGAGMRVTRTTFETVARRDRPAVFEPDASA